MSGWIVKMVSRGVLALLLAGGAAFALDWVVWRVREARGAGYGAVTVTRFVVAPLKGNKMEYYPDGTGEERCSRSIFGQGDVNACWWTERHKIVFE